jgi:hypothetical protein
LKPFPHIWHLNSIRQVHLRLVDEQRSSSYRIGNYFESNTVLHQKPGDNNGNDLLVDFVRLGVNSKASDSIIAKHRSTSDGGTGFLEGR